VGKDSIEVAVPSYSGGRDWETGRIKFQASWGKVNETPISINKPDVKAQVGVCVYDPNYVGSCR
jgi:hypothetical protein